MSQKRVIERLDEVTAAEDPFRLTKKLSGVNLYSIRVADYRVIVSIEKAKMVVLVLDVGHRSKIYKKV
jgi:mRNA interferase RelE/StbE